MTERKRSICVVAAFMLLIGIGQVQGATFYVAPGGDDGADGSEAAPFKTIARAQQAVRQHLKERDYKGDVSVVISGRHFLSEPLVFTPEDTAKDDSVVAYQSHETDRAVLSGGRTIGGWKQNGQQWQAEIAEAKSAGWRFRELFVGGQRRPRARTPTEGYFRVVKAGPDNRTSFFYKAGDLRRWSKLHAAELVFLHDWSVSRVGIANIDEASRSVHLVSPVGRSSPHFAMTNFESRPRYAIENAPELLDSPGEWYLDAESGVLTYWPVANEELSKVEVIAPVATGLITVRGDESNARPVRNLRFEGLTLSHCAWSLPPGGYAESQATHHAERHGDPNSPSAFIPAAVTFDAAENCAVERCRLEHLGGTAVWFRRACRNNRVAHSVIRDVAANGVNVGEAQVDVPSAEAVAAGRALSPVSQGNAITHCRVTRCGALYYGAVGVWVGMAKATEISSNEIRNLPYTGVSVGWNWSPAKTVCEGNLIASNHIHHVMQLLSDGAGIYTLGRQPGTVLRGNIIHDVPINSGRAESNGMFIDEGSTELLIESNVIYNTARSPIRFHQAGKNTLRNNQLVVQPKMPPFRYNSTPDDIMAMEGNQIVESAGWIPPRPESVGPE
jgi:hypothetical protein